MNTPLRTSFCLILLAVGATGCSVFDTSTRNFTDADVKTQLNDAQRIASYFNKINPPSTTMDKSGKIVIVPVSAPVRTVLGAALGKYVPRDFQIVPDGDVELGTEITYDTSQAWMEALSKAMANVGVDVTVSLHTKTLYLNAIRTPLSAVIEKNVPDGYKVYTDADVNIDTPVRYNMSRYWLDALTKGASDAGIEVTANMTRKIVVLKVGNTPRPTIKHEISRSQPQQENGRPVDDESRLAVVSK